MEMQYATKLFNFNADVRHTTMTLEAAVEAIKSDEAEVLILDVVPPDEVHEWWDDDGFVSSPFTKNSHHAGIVSTGITMGQLQRETKERLVVKSGEYFSTACRINDDLRRTRFVKLFSDTLDAKPLTMDGVYPYEFLIATRRIYDPFDKPFNFAPHCDDITYGRDAENWPMRVQYPQQISLFLTAQTAANDAGMVMWDYKPDSRAVLDKMHTEYTETGAIAELERSAHFVVRPQPGQLTIFQCKYMHGIERCTSQRRTMGMFLLDHKDGWRFYD
jgi:hypothetical protein